MTPVETQEHSAEGDKSDSWIKQFAPLALVIGWALITVVQSVILYGLLDESRARLLNTHNFLLSVNEFSAAVTDAETGQRGFIITMKEPYLEPYTRGSANVASTLDQLELLQSAEPNQLAKIARLRELWAVKKEEMAASIDVARTSGTAAAKVLVEEDRGKAAMDEIRTLVDEFEAAERNLRATVMSEVDINAKRLITFNMLTTLIGFGGLLILVWQARQTAEELRHEIANRISAQELSRERAGQALRTRIMNRELLHRTKNLISVVQAIVRHQAGRSPEVQTYVASLGQRLSSLAGTMDILVRDNWSAVSLSELIKGQLAHFAEEVSTRIVVKPGPLVLFTASEAQMVGLAIHELGTNAAKYGALSVESGRVEITWTATPMENGADGEQQIVMTWSETGGPALILPRERRGFGTRLTEQLVGRAVDGITAVNPTPEGFHWSLTFHRKGELRGQDHESSPADVRPED